MGKSALLMWGGWDGHTPKETTAIMADELKKNGFAVRVESSLAPLEDKEALKKLNLIVPCWTMGEMSDAQWGGLSEAVASGVGLGGVHGGMGDAFRGRIEYQWMVGGQFLGHPYVGKYTVNVIDVDSPITHGMPKHFEYDSEQYYMQVDPGMRVLANTIYEHEGRRAVMPVVWTKSWGQGRVFYSALGHSADELKKYPEVIALTTRGLLWAAKD